MIAANALNQTEDRKVILETIGDKERLEALCVCLAREIKFAGVEKVVQMRIKSQIDKNQKDYYLREQMKAIQEELGEDDLDDIESYRARLEKTPLNEEAREKAEKEIDRLSRMVPGTPEINVTETYLDWILDLPWGKYTKDQTSLTALKILRGSLRRSTLKADHRARLFGMRLKEDPVASMRAIFLCGPPGWVRRHRQAVARHGQEVHPDVLGGVRDKQNIRAPERISAPSLLLISGIKAPAPNPVFLFDEVDKMGSDFRGSRQPCWRC